MLGVQDWWCSKFVEPREQVGDGIACVYGLNEIQVGEMVEFASCVRGTTLNPENENVGIVVFGSDIAIKERDLVKCTRSIVDVPVGKAMLGCVVDTLGVPIDGRGALSHENHCTKSLPTFSIPFISPFHYKVGSKLQLKLQVIAV